MRASESFWESIGGPEAQEIHVDFLAPECPHDYIVEGVNGPVCLRCNDASFPGEDDPWARYIP